MEAHDNRFGWTAGHTAAWGRETVDGILTPRYPGVNRRAARTRRERVGLDTLGKYTRRVRCVPWLILLAACSPDVEKTYFEDGRLYTSTSRRAGFLHGLQEFHSGEGHLERSGTWHYGVRQGEWLYYWPSGQLRSRQHYVDGVRHGQWTEWHETGPVSRQGQWHHGDKDGVWEFWKVDGTPLAREVWQRGTRLSVERM